MTPARIATACVVVFMTGTLAAVSEVRGDRPSQVLAGGPPVLSPASLDLAPLPVPVEPTTPTTIMPPTTALPPTTAPTVPRPTGRMTTTTTAKVTTTTTAGPSGLGPRPAGSVVFDYQSGRSAWSGRANGITLQVQIDPAVPRAGDPVRFHVVADDPARECCLNSLLFGDGGSAQDPTNRCSDDTSGAAQSDFTHTYNKPGRWEFSFQAMSGRCSDHNTYGALYGVIEVIVRTSRGQGPAQPTIQASEARAPGDPVVPGYIKVWANARDEDGYILQFTIDFGDGHATEIRMGDPAACQSTPSGWPAPSTAAIQEPYPANQYDVPGSYTITITVVTTGCDRTDEQRAVATIPFRW